MLDVICKAKYMHSIFIQNDFMPNFVPKDLCYWYPNQPPVSFIFRLFINM